MNEAHWRERAAELEQHSVLSRAPRTCLVYAALEAGMRQTDVADELNITESTVTRHKQRAKHLIDEAHWTVDNTD